MQNGKIYCLCLHNRVLSVVKKLGYEPQVILSGRKVNDNMSNVIVEKISKKLKKNKSSKNSKSVPNENPILSFL